MIVKESLSDFLKPKDTEEVIKAFKSQPIHQQVDFLEDKEELLSDNITFKDYPLIYQIKMSMYYTESFKQLYRITAFDIMWSSEITNYIGQVFKLYKKDTFTDAIYIREYNDKPNVIYISGSTLNSTLIAETFKDTINKLSQVEEIPVNVKRDLIHTYDSNMTNI